MTNHTTVQRFDAGDVVLQSGRTFPGMHIAYTTYGTLNADRSNVIVYPTSYSAQHTDTEWLVRDGVFLEKPVRGFRAMGRLYASMALSQDF